MGDRDQNYYWIKLDHKRFESGGDMDLLMSQKDGADYVVLYMMLCLITRNTDGEMVSRLGELTVPYDVDRIVRDCRYFSRQTVEKALDLYRKLGLIYAEENGNLVVSNHSQMVGSSSRWAAYKRTERASKKAEIGHCPIIVQTDVQDNVQEMSSDLSKKSPALCQTPVQQDIRDKEIRDKRSDKEIYIEDSFHSSSVGLTPTEKAENAEISTSPSPGNQPSVIMKSQKNGPLNGNLSPSEEGSVQNGTDDIPSLRTKPCDERKQDASGVCALPDSSSLSGQDSPPFADDETVPSACPPPEKDTVPYQTIVEAYNSTCKTMPKCTRLSAKRRKSVAVCWKTHGDEIFRGLEKAAASDFLSGRSEDWTGCCFDWLMNSNNMLKVLEGIYDNRGAERKRIERIRRNPLARDYTGQYADDVFPEM